ncbi:MAG: gamma-glutamyltransferase [Bacillota bacterium]|nr:gamma-glutamyltransferase [Bacillota bacterium]
MARSGVANNGMVTSLHELASHAGVEVLKKGGNAVDAAIATCFALNVVLPAMCSIGGEGRALIHIRRTGETTVVNWSGRCPGRATPDMYELEPERGRLLLGPSVPLTGWVAVKDDANEYGYKSMMVPGSIAGYAKCLESFGTLSMAEVMQPAIRLAEEGFPITPLLARHIGENADLLSRYPASAQVFLKEGIHRKWDINGLHLWLVQTDLAETLKKIADGGPDVFYRGEIARRIADAHRENGGLITEDDLARYQPEVLEPSRGSFLGYEVYGVPGGGTTVVQILNILDGFDLGGYHLNSPELLHLFAEAVRLTFHDRVRFISGDLEAVPWKGLCSKEHARELREQIDPRRATSVEVEVVSDPWYYNGDTTHLCVVDEDRNVVSATITIGSAFGSRVVIPGTGILMNNLMKSMNPEPGDINSVGPWKRRRIPHAASLVTKRGTPFLAVGSPGGEVQIVATSQVILNVLLHGLSIQEAIDAPRLFRGLRDDIYVTEDMPAETVAGLEEMGHRVVRKNPEKFGFGRPNGILIDPEGVRVLYGGIDRYSDGLAAGY